MNFQTIDIQTLTLFIQNNYLANDDDTFQLYYTIDIIEWSLNESSIIIGLFDNTILIGTITASPITCVIRGQIHKLSEINYLCLDKKYRTIGNARILIEEIAKMSQQIDYPIGFFTGAHTYKIYNNFSKIQFYHRLINIEKLIKNDFTSIDMKEEQLSEIEQYYGTIYPKYITTYNFILLTNNDFDLIKDVYELYINNYKQHNYEFYQLYSYDEFYTLLSNKIAYTYLIYDSDKLFDFVTFYVMPQKNVNTQENINCCFIFAYTDNIISIQSMYTHLLYNIYMTPSFDIDVMTLTNIMNYDKIINDPIFKIDKGTGHLYYNLYSFIEYAKIEPIEPQNIARMTI